MSPSKYAFNKFSSKTLAAILLIGAAICFVGLACSPVSAEEPGSQNYNSIDFALAKDGPPIDDGQLEQMCGKGEEATKFAFPVAVILWDEDGRKGRGVEASGTTLASTLTHVTLTLNGK